MPQQVFTLSRIAFAEVADKFPRPMLSVNRAMRKVMMRRALLHYLCTRYRGSPPRSFVCRSAASGYSYVQGQLTIEQKVDRLFAYQERVLGSQSSLFGQGSMSPILTAPAAGGGGGGASADGLAPSTPLVPRTAAPVAATASAAAPSTPSLSLRLDHAPGAAASSAAAASASDSWSASMSATLQAVLQTQKDVLDAQRRLEEQVGRLGGRLEAIEERVEPSAVTA